MLREKKEEWKREIDTPFSVLLAPSFRYYTIRISLLTHIVHNLLKWHVVSNENKNCGKVMLV